MKSMIVKENQVRNESALEVARAMMRAARTAPKAKGVDNLEIAMVHGSDLNRLSEAMKEQAQRRGMAFFERDAQCVASSEAVVLIGLRADAPVQGLNCGYCGSDTCGGKAKMVPCFFGAHDLGLAVGSAVSLAADLRVDSRVMFSAGVTALELGLMEECSQVLAIPISVSGKSPFFDRAIPATAK